MIPDDSDERPGEGLQNVLDGLEHLARDLDGRRCPGCAWPSARRRAAGRRWRILIPLGAAAAAMLLVAALIQHYAARPDDGGAGHATAGAIAAASAPAPAGESEEPAMPLVLIVEDLDSYSVIDLTCGVPLVTFAMKSSCVPGPVVPILPEPSEPTTGEGT